MAGLIQGSGWLNGQVVYKILPELHTYFVFRLGFGILIFSGAVVGLLQHCAKPLRLPKERGGHMRMTLKLIIYGGLIIFAPILFVSVILPWVTISEKPSEIFRPRKRSRARGTKDLHRKWVHVLPHPVHPQHRLGARGRTDCPLR